MKGTRHAEPRVAAAWPAGWLRWISSARGFFLCWTILAAIAIWSLAFGESRPSTFLTGTDAEGTDHWRQRFLEWLTLAKSNFGWVIPWILFAPHVLWLGYRFHLRRRDIRRRAIALLAGGVVFVGTASWLSARIDAKQGGVITLVMTGMKQPSIRNVLDERPELAALLEQLERFKDGLAPHSPGSWLSTNAIRFRIDGRTSLRMEEAPPAPPDPPPPIAEIEFAAGTNSPISHAVWAKRPRFNEDVFLHLLAYAGLLVLAHAIAFHYRSRERELRADVLEGQLNQARLSALQAQMQPHFLFNTLNGIATLVRRDPEAAEETIVALGDLLRASLGKDRQQEIPFREELAFLDRYLAIQRMRFGDRMDFRQCIDEEVLDCPTPILLLQPLVENAILHGIEPSDGGRTVWITAERDGTRVRILIEDDGAGCEGDIPPRSGGIGLGNLAARLEALHPGEYEFVIEEREGGGTRVRISFPARITGGEGAP